ncbi:MAG: DUF481 domain-containing protein [Candidatus Binatia bacterium]
MGHSLAGPARVAGPVVFLLAVAWMMPATVAHADRLVAKGTTLTGKVKILSGAGVEFAPDFAKDSMLVPWENVDDVATDANFQVLYGDGLEAIAPVGGYRDGHLLVGDASVEPQSLVSAVELADAEPGFLDRTRSTLRYWHGDFSLGFNLQRATTDNLGLLVAVTALRSKGPTRLILGADYRYLEQENPDSITKDSASGVVRGEYDLSERIYLYGSADALYDAVQNLSLRAVPKAGAGYVIWKREPKEGVRDFLQVEAGGGWVYEKYIDNGTPPDPVMGENDYFTVALGASAAVLLPRGAAFDWRFDYLPSVSDFTGDYVIRTAAGLTVPLIAPLSARLSVADTYDSTPSGGAKENSLFVDTSLSVAW